MKLHLPRIPGRPIERLVRAALARTLGVQRVHVDRSAAEDLVQQVAALDGRLEQAEQARLAAERALDRAVFELERLFNFVPALLIFKTPDGVLLRVNKHTADGFGLEPADMVGKHQRDFWPPDQCANFERDDKRILANRQGEFGYLEPVQWGDEVHQFRTWKAPLWNGAADPIGVMLFAVDVTWLASDAHHLQDPGPPRP